MINVIFIIIIIIMLLVISILFLIMQSLFLCLWEHNVMFYDRIWEIEATFMKTQSDVSLISLAMCKLLMSKS